MSSSSSTPSSGGPVRYQAISGSAREELSGVTRLGDADADANVQVTVVLRRPAPVPGAPGPRIRADPDDVAAVLRFAQDNDLWVDSVDVAGRAVVLSGTVAQMNSAFKVSLGLYRLDKTTTFRGRSGEVQVPVDVAPSITAVLGLDERPQARANFWVNPLVLPGYPPQEVARRYGFPTTSDGTGQTVAVLELGGGFDPADLQTYFTGQGLKMPKVTAVPVGGGQNSPGGDADGEVALDIEVIGAVAQGAAQAVYFAPNTTDGFYQIIAAAVHDQTNKPSVISISWGGPESSWTPQAMDSYDALFADAATLGITVFVAAGDRGSADGSQDNSSQVDFPASSPHVVACGGTTLTDSGETVWNKMTAGQGATGGGVSRHFPLPAYQGGAKVPANPDNKPGRGVPDVAGDADPTTGYQVRVGGKDQVVGGTSAVAPLWAGLTAIANQANNSRAGAKGDVHQALYQAPQAFTDITSGDNGAYQAGPGWDPCTGLGRPNGAQVVQVLGTT
jgi:kumamolisin